MINRYKWTIDEILQFLLLLPVQWAQRIQKIICWTSRKSVQILIELVFIMVISRFGSFGRWVKGWPHSWHLWNLLSWFWWHQSCTFSRGVPAPQSVVCFSLCVGRKQDWNKIPTKTFLMHCCLSVFERMSVFLFGPHAQGSCQATIHVCYAFTFTHFFVLIHPYYMYHIQAIQYVASEVCK